MPKSSHEDLGIPRFAARLLSDYSMTEGHQREVVLGFLLVDIASMLGEDYILEILEFLCTITDQGPEIAKLLYSHYTAVLSREPESEVAW